LEDVRDALKEALLEIAGEMGVRPEQVNVPKMNSFPNFNSKANQNEYMGISPSAPPPPRDFTLAFFRQQTNVDDLKSGLNDGIIYRFLAKDPTPGAEVESTCVYYQVPLDFILFKLGKLFDLSKYLVHSIDPRARSYDITPLLKDFSRGLDQAMIDFFDEHFNNVFAGSLEVTLGDYRVKGDVDFSYMKDTLAFRGNQILKDDANPAQLQEANGYLKHFTFKFASFYEPK
jgi:hypothetical protein